MVEYHGWVKISETTCESEDDERLLKAVLSKVDSLIERNRTNDHVKLLDQNGSYTLSIHGNHNHFDEYPITLFKGVANLAKGSYGLLYYQDDEDQKHMNEFQVWKMARGEVDKVKDVFLSPCIPTLED